MEKILQHVTAAYRTFLYLSCFITDFRICAIFNGLNVIQNFGIFGQIFQKLKWGPQTDMQSSWLSKKPTW